MGLVKRVRADSVATGEPGSVDMASVIRQAVTDEIERRRLESWQKDTEADPHEA